MLLYLTELYIAVVLIMGALSVVLSIYVLELYHRPDDHPIPEFVQTLTVLGMRINCYKTTCCCRRKVEPEEGEFNTLFLALNVWLFLFCVFKSFDIRRRFNLLVEVLVFIILSIHLLQFYRVLFRISVFNIVTSL